MHKTILTLLVVLTLSLSSLAQELVEQVYFPAGSNSTQIRRGIARGETMRFLLGARGGQVMTVVVQSPEKNAVFEVWGDGGQLGSSQEANGKQKWSGVLPGNANSTIAVEVGSLRGGSEFSIYFEIR